KIRVGRSAVAVPVHDSRRAVVGGLAAIGPTGRLAVDDTDLVNLLREYAGRVAPGGVRTPS
ncbi:IclR family transcriptional regulator, partial [Rhodococcus hoagii]|nr:IclR family transcriptional regulator [Prescottella equi]